MHKPSSLGDYTVASLIGAATIAFLGFYFFIRQGYIFDAPTWNGPLYLPNKILAGAGLILIGISFLVGPVTRYFDRFDWWLQYRKELGIVGGFLAIAHGLLSLVFMPEKFPLHDLFSPTHWHIATAGVLGALILALLIVISFKYFIDLLGGSRWWYLQRWGLRFAVFFTLLHVLPMKWESWSEWFISGGGAPSPGVIYPDMVPASLLVTLFLLWVCVVRIYESWSLFRSLGIETKEISLDLELKQKGRNFFGLSLLLLIVLYLIIVVRWIA